MATVLLACCLGCASLLDDVNVPQGDPVVVLRGEDASQPITFLSWDTEGGGRAKMNLLYAPVSLWIQSDGTWAKVTADSSQVVWSATQEGARITLSVYAHDPNLERVRLVFPFSPKSAATTFIPEGWSGHNEMRLPGIISTPDFGQMLLTVGGNDSIRSALVGKRVGEHTVDLHLEWPVGDEQGIAVSFVLEPLRLAMPVGFHDEHVWQAIRRGWFNMLQPSCQWGEKGRPQSAPPGLLSNNVVSDPVSCVLHMMADHVLLQPTLAPGISATVPLRNTLDWWLDNGIAENGEMVSWRNVHGMLDANAGPVIGAWCYVEASGDTGWLSGRIGTLEFLADYLAKRDQDGNGLVESVYSGNYGTQIGRLGASAYDTINSGYEDAYLNALAYRAWRCLADLERMLGRHEPAERYTRLADRLKAAFKGRFYNPKTGWLAWWLSKDGELHDLHAPMITSIAIMCGNTTGYEGHLVYSFSFLQAVLYRDDNMRQRVLRPLLTE